MMRRCRSSLAFFCFYLFIEGSSQLPNVVENSTIRLQRCPKSVDSVCALPSQIENAKWSIVGDNNTIPEGSIKINSVLKIECYDGYKLSSKTPYMVCDQDWDISKLPLCEKRCPPIYASSTMILKCEDKYGKEVPCDEAVDGTYLSYSCVPFYETPFGYKKTMLCVDGSWNYPKPVCQPVCGKKIEKDTIKLLYGGTIKEEREYPWIIAIYQKMGDEYQNICGGSLVSQRVIITAAHCLTNDYGNKLPTNQFTVAAGKYYTKYKDSRDIEVQYSEVERIVIKSGYKGAPQRFLADIALLVTKDLIVINDVIQPVCYQNINNIYLQAGKIGVVAGWGKAGKEDQPDELRTLEIPFKHQQTCAQELPPDWADKFNTIDKICTGFYNQSKGVCTGDSGSGLYFLNRDDNRYYVHGVVSIAPAVKGECNIQQNALYTRVAHYYDFVDREVTRQYVQQCILPPYPINGKWTVSKQSKKPGDIVASNTVLKVECNSGYILSSTSAHINCESANVMPKCELLCPQLTLPQGTIYRCNNEKGDEIDCAKAVTGTRLVYSCPEGYTTPSDVNQVTICMNGAWGVQKPECMVQEKPKQPDRPKEDTPKQENRPSQQDSAAEGKVVCTYASWYASNKVFPEDLNVTLCTHIVYSFAALQVSSSVRAIDKYTEIDGNKKGLYRRFTDLKMKNKDLKIILSIGSTDGSDKHIFSSIARNQTMTLAFVSSVVQFIETYNFDGANIEWFYPEKDDQENYIDLLRSFRDKFNEKNWLLTATVRSYTDDVGYDGRKMSELLDWIHLRTYDFYGPWSTYTGQNSPLYPSGKENNWEKGHLNIDASVKNWINAGVPKSKIVLSIAFYGRSFILQDKNENGIHAPFTGAGVYDGVIRYSEMCPYKNWTTVWDDEQKSVYSYRDNDWVGHENKRSVWTKAAYARENGLLGVNVWPVDGDDILGKCGMKQILLKHVNAGWANYQIS